MAVGRDRQKLIRAERGDSGYGRGGGRAEHADGGVAADEVPISRCRARSGLP